MHLSFIRCAALAACLTLLWSCSSKTPVAPPKPETKAIIADHKNFPQDLNDYVGQDGNVPLIDARAQKAQYAMFREKVFHPWRMEKCSVKKKGIDALLKRKARGWKNGTEQWTNEEWAQMRANADMGTWPSMAVQAITLRSTDVREMPTTVARYSKPTPDPIENPFDNFQYSRLPVGIPVIVGHATLDGEWFFVENSWIGGWVKAEDIAPVSSKFTAEYQSMPLGAIVSEGVDLGDGVSANIGAFLPMKDSHTLLVPERDGNGMGRLREASVSAKDVARMPLTMTKSAVAKLGNQLIGQRYGWGEMLGLRDCSATTNALMTPFGIWLAKYSQAQSRNAQKIRLDGMGVAEKEQAILASGVPMASLLIMPGHVVLYVGEHKGRPAILHNMWGVRVNDPARGDRHVVGRTSVTSLTPGAELPNVKNPESIGPAFRTLAILGGASNP